MKPVAVGSVATDVLFTACWLHANCGGIGGSILHGRSNVVLAAVIFRADSVSVIFPAT